MTKRGEARIDLVDLSLPTFPFFFFYPSKNLSTSLFITRETESKKLSLHVFHGRFSDGMEEIR